MFFQSEKSWWNARIWAIFSAKIIFIFLFVCFFLIVMHKYTYFWNKFDTLEKCKNVVSPSMKIYFLESRTYAYAR